MGASMYKEIGKAIADELRQVPGTGRVHEFQRYAAGLEKYLGLFRTEGDGGQGKLLGWIVTREAASEGLGSFAGSQGQGFTPSGVNRRVHTFLILGRMGLEDGAGSELAFQDLIEAVCDRLRDNNVLRLRDASGAPRVPTLERLGPPQVDAVDVRAFGPALCHAAELRVQAIERIVRA
ncbi:MAG: hypothetical protein HYY66_08690 [Candidatus Tectomicrobia bacterium]|nr:hypothetical protein [Candidatus Tectomicrobia bacterium]